MCRANIAIPILCTAILTLTACEGSPNYHGDGTFTDAGPTTAHERYVVDLGRIDLGSPSHHSFKLIGLPATEFTMGLRQVNVSAGCDASAVSSVRVRLDVKTDNGSVVIAEEGPLNEWVTSPSLIYRRGAESKQPKAGGAFELVPTGVRASGGWGTYLTPQTSTMYLANLEVLDPHGTAGCESRLVLLGGGWK